MNVEDILKAANGDKTTAFELIQKQDPATKIDLLLKALNGSTLYQLFAEQRGLRKTSLERGTLNKLVESLMNELRSLAKSSPLYQKTCQQLNDASYDALRNEIKKRVKKENALDQHLLKATDFANRSEPEKALAEYEKVVKQIENAPIHFPDDIGLLAFCHYCMGNLHLYSDPAAALIKYEEAEEILKCVIEFSTAEQKQNHQVHTAKIQKNKGVAYALLKKYEDAETCINQVIALEAEMEEKSEYDTLHFPQVDLINIHLAKKEWRAAIRVIKASELDSKYLLGKALAYFHLKDFDEVRNILKEMDENLLSWNESDSVTTSLYLKGLLAFKDKQFEKALSLFKRFQSMHKPNQLSNSPFLMELDYQLGVTYLALNKTERGLSHLNKMLEKNPLHTASYNAIAMDYAKRHQQPEETEGTLLYKAKLYKGVLYCHYKQLEKAIECFLSLYGSLKQTSEKVKDSSAPMRATLSKILDGLGVFSKPINSSGRPAHLAPS